MFVLLFLSLFACLLILTPLAVTRVADAAYYPPKACADGIDNDEDGLVDLADFGCTNAEDNDERFPECFDGIDNDSDGFIDFPADTNCSSVSDTDELHPSACMDGIDNDGDDLFDEKDSGCRKEYV